ncbi:probable glucan 1,3-beta-glucosidase A [Salvia hispanica]|uniref:probable glucan 1,3-beta-glucosidase A n=1 Tax=Salvia hispanica TaxID=49212 RepID=UPI00200904E0|nr:probable glucan 1,3-beta-glucosidase A [Salvia hispanica]
MNTKSLFIFSITCFCILSTSNGRTGPNDGLPVRAVNLGGWLVTEGWIKPSLFDAIPNKDLLDGSGVHLKSVTVGKYLCAETGGGSIIVANRSSVSTWEAFSLWRINETTFNLRVFNRQFVGLDSHGNGVDIVAIANAPSQIQTFHVDRNPNDLNRVRIRASNGFYLQVKSEELVSADYEGNDGWGDDNPSVFILSTNGGLQGEYQITNGYGPLLAPLVMKEHWNTYIVEDDFKFIKENGFNAVRIPVGWWIASDPNPPKPYVGGSLQALDNAFSWAEKYRIKVIIDLHAAPGSQNGWEHSASRDRSLEWGQTDENIQQTVDVIEFLTARYAKSPSLFAMELINEPLSPGVSLDSLTKYYRAGLEAVRRHSQTAYVVLADRLGPHEPRELLDFAKGFTKVAIDVHHYNLFSPMFDNLSAQQNIDYVNINRAQQLSHITDPNGPLVFVGEWTAAWRVKDASKEDYERYAAAQLRVFGQAQFGWAYWTLKNVKEHWSLEWVIKNGIIKL